MIDMPNERINRGRGIFGGEGTMCTVGKNENRITSRYGTRCKKSTDQITIEE